MEKILSKSENSYRDTIFHDKVQLFLINNRINYISLLNNISLVIRFSELEGQRGVEVALEMCMVFPGSMRIPTSQNQSYDISHLK